MPRRWSLAFLLFLACGSVAVAKDKKKVLLPDDILEARTVLVVVDPDSGVSVADPLANRKAQEDVEKALMNWGRFRLAMEASNADLVISVRKGNGKTVQPTVTGVPINNRPIIFEPSDSGGRVGVHTGNAPGTGDPTYSQPQGPSPQMEAGASEDMFAVFRGDREGALDYPPVWRYTTKDALRSPTVPAVDEFRKLIAEAEKQRAARP